jgi:hypothetical protein
VQLQPKSGTTRRAKFVYLADQSFQSLDLEGVKQNMRRTGGDSDGEDGDDGGGGGTEEEEAEEAEAEAEAAAVGDEGKTEAAYSLKGWTRRQHFHLPRHISSSIFIIATVFFFVGVVSGVIYINDE